MSKKGITRERTGLLLQELLKVLWAFADGLRAEKATEIVASRIQLTEHEKGEYDNGGRRFDKILMLCTMDAVKAGWMTKNDGIWSLTAKGITALKRYPEPDQFYREVSRLYRQWRSKRELATKITYEMAEARAWKEINNYFDAMAPDTFQHIIAAVLEAMGYFIAWVSPTGKDGGIAFLAWHDPHGACPPSIKVHAKRRKEAIDIEEMHRFLASINKGEVGIFVSTGGFCKDAEDYARTNGQREIKLYDTRCLIDLWIQHNAKIQKEKRALLPLRPIYFIAPTQEQQEANGQGFEKTLCAQTHPPASFTV